MYNNIPHIHWNMGEVMTNFTVVPLRRGFVEIQNLFNYVVNPMDGILCGGYARYCASPLYKPIEASDVDIYCRNDSVYDKIKKRFEEDKLEVRHENEISLTYKRPESKDHPFFYSPPIQLIKPMKEGAIVAVGTVEEILNNFDFSVIRAAILGPNTVLVDEHFLEDESKKQLRLKNIHCPISSMLRCMKYSRKGYWMRPFEALKLCMDWESRDAAYKEKIVKYLHKSMEGGKDSLTKEEVEELEALMRID